MPQGSLTVNRTLVRHVGAAAQTARTGSLPQAGPLPQPGTMSGTGAGTVTGSRTATGLAAETSDSRVTWLLVLRPVLLTIVLGAAVALDLPASQPLSVQFAGVLLGLCYGLTTIYAAARPLIARWPWIIDAQLVVDAALISTIVLLTGGFESNFVPLYVLPILAGSVIRLARGGMTIAAVSAAMFGLLVASQFGLVVPQPQVWGLDLMIGDRASSRSAFYTVGLHCLGFLAVARLTGYLAENLHRTDLRLQRASNTLADMKAYNQHVIDSLTGGLAATDTHGRVIMFNRVAETITGESAANVLGRTVLEVLQLPAEIRRALRDVNEPGRARRTDYTFMTRNGQPIDIGLSIGPLIGTSGQVGHLFTFQDLTEYKRREREEQRQKRMAAVGEMAAGIAHEIRNPLASMSGSMQLLRQELNLNGEQTQLFDIVLRESDRLNDTIRNFLLYARPQQKKATMVDVRRVLTEAAQLIRNNPESHSTHEIALDLPPTDVTCEADEGQIRQIVWNLATNAIRAMPHGGTLTLGARAVPGVSGEPHVPGGSTSLAAGLATAAAAAENLGVILSVRDQGVGIAPDALDRIFQPFHGGFAKGAGLGLAIVHRIVTDHGGEIRVSSQVGVGTTIDVHWPARQTVEPRPQPETFAQTPEMASEGVTV